MMAKHKILETTTYVEITKESGEVIDRESFKEEIWAHNHFEKLEKIRWPETYKGLTMNLSEFFTGGNIGRVRVVFEDSKGERYIRRELFRNA